MHAPPSISLPLLIVSFYLLHIHAQTKPLHFLLFAICLLMHIKIKGLVLSVCFQRGNKKGNWMFEDFASRPPSIFPHRHSLPPHLVSPYYQIIVFVFFSLLFIPHSKRTIVDGHRPSKYRNILFIDHIGIPLHLWLPLCPALTSNLPPLGVNPSQPCLSAIRHSGHHLLVVVVFIVLWNVTFFLTGQIGHVSVFFLFGG